MRASQFGRASPGLQGGPRALPFIAAHKKGCSRRAARAEAREGRLVEDVVERGSRNAEEACKVQGTLSALDAFLPAEKPEEIARSEPTPDPSAAVTAAVVEPAASADEKRTQSGAAASTSSVTRNGEQDAVLQSLLAFGLQWARNAVKPTRLVSQDDTDLPRAKPRLAYLVLAANLAVYGTGLGFRFLEGDIGPQDFFLSLASVNEAVEAGEYYRIVSANFLHDSFAHLCASSYALLTIAPEAEAVLGPFAFGTTYLLAGAAGTTLCFLLTDTLTVGASSGIFGLIGALGAYLYKTHKVPNSSDQLFFTAGLLAFNLVMGHKQESAIDNLGHLGGLAAGIYLGWLLTATLVRSSPDAASQPQQGEGSPDASADSAAEAPSVMPTETGLAAPEGVAAEAAERQAVGVRVVQPSPLQSLVVLLSVSTTIASSVAAAVLYRTGELPMPRLPTWLM